MRKQFKKSREEIYSDLITKTLLKLYSFDENLISESFFKLSTIKKEFREVMPLGFVKDYPKCRAKLYTNFKQALGIKSIIGFDLSKDSAFDSFRLSLLGYVENRVTFDDNDSDSEDSNFLFMKMITHSFGNNTESNEPKSLKDSWNKLYKYVQDNKERARRIANQARNSKRKRKTFDRDSNLLSDPVVGMPMTVKADIVDPFEDIQIFL